MASGYYPSSNGPQQASKYPRVGPNYMKYGEQPGWIYDYSIDRYRRDPKVDQELGFTKKEAGLTEQLMPIAAIAGGSALATEGGKAVIPAVKGLFSLGGGASTAGATTGTAATGAGATTAAATTGAEAGAAGASGAGMGAVALPAAAALYGAYRGYKMWDRLKDEGGGTKGAKKGAQIGFKPQNLAIFGTSSPLIGGLMGALGGSNRWETEQNRLNALREQGYQGVPELNLSGGRSKQQLVDEAKATGGNVEFAQTRNESTLKPQDIVGYASIIEKAGPQSTLDQRLKLATDALNAGAVREHHGTVDVDWSKVGQASPAGMQQVTPQVAQGLLGIDAGTRKRWREAKGI